MSTTAGAGPGNTAEIGPVPVGAGIRVVKGDPGPAELAAVVAVLCARAAAPAAHREAGGPEAARARAAHWPRSAAGAGPALVGWSHRPGAPWRPRP
ncbi:acyl-CoA carboxylase epsilon subunit [Streptomyces lavendulocolor]|uniref:acyl-CoA carboxylase epsilon subunit n=1 Tax=Streptomyces lavendulocolor TaxID=67316 RepID=UPI003C2F457F